MKLEVCYGNEEGISVRTICEEIQVSSSPHEVRFELLTANKQTKNIAAANIYWIRPYAAPKRVRAKAGTQ